MTKSAAKVPAERGIPQHGKPVHGKPEHGKPEHQIPGHDEPRPNAQKDSTTQQGERYCPVCEKSAKEFKPFGIVPRLDAQCSHCGALERHRLTWLFINRHTDLFDGQPKKMLHVAPEPCFEKKFREQLGDGYLTSDLYNPAVMEKMNICDIQYPDNTFDVIYCSHVLEHVADDKLAMRELFRVLKPGGWAILNVPVTASKTFEDPSIVSPAERLRLFGQEDHVRRYGPDYVDRLRHAGFKVDITEVGDLLSADEAERMGLKRNGGQIYYCRK
jgi:SAM-dependent methyltransferase